jgi:hypothetical protein
MIPIILFWKGQNCGDSKEISSCQGLEDPGLVNRQNIEEF